jgi:hypothetical protein
MASPITWKGEQWFKVVGTGLHEDTLRLRCNQGRQEATHRLVLPTLCITYADMKFANGIGGEQLRWPDSQVYGPTWFDPAVEIVGHDEVERLTWIRGAHRVVIGPKVTEIEWYDHQELVVPRLRLDTKEPIEALMQVQNVRIEQQVPMRVDVAQIADGRRIGGVSWEKQHPDYQPPRDRDGGYRLWIRVVDAATGGPLLRSRLALFHWKGDDERGAFVPVETASADSTGSVLREDRPAGDLEAAVLAMPGWRAEARVWRALPGQPLTIVMHAHRLQRVDRPKGLGGAQRELYRAEASLGPGDATGQLASRFGYEGAAELEMLNRGTKEENADQVLLPGWVFLTAREGDTLRGLAHELQVDPGHIRVVSRRHRPDADGLLPHEVIAVPTPEFAASHKLG